MSGICRILCCCWGSSDMQKDVDEKSQLNKKFLEDKVEDNFEKDQQTPFGTPESAYGNQGHKGRVTDVSPYKGDANKKI